MTKKIQGKEQEKRNVCRKDEKFHSFLSEIEVTLRQKLGEGRTLWLVKIKISL